MPTTASNAEILAQAPALVATAKARGWVRTGPLRPPMPTAPQRSVFADIAVDANFPTLAVRVRKEGDAWVARTEQGDRAQSSIGEYYSVLRAALRSYEQHAAIRRVPLPDLESIAAVQECAGVWVTAVRAKEAL